MCGGVFFLFQTNEVNQGDSFEHDFSALTACLIFPVQKILPFGIPLVSFTLLLHFIVLVIVLSTLLLEFQYTA